MNASTAGSKDWWVVVQTMPHIEALQHLQEYKVSLLAAPPGPELTRVNMEIKRINTAIDNGRWYRACADTLPPELFEAVRVRKQQLQDMEIA